VLSPKILNLEFLRLREEIESHLGVTLHEVGWGQLARTSSDRKAPLSRPIKLFRSRAKLLRSLAMALTRCSLQFSLWRPSGKKTQHSELPIYIV